MLAPRITLFLIVISSPLILAQTPDAVSLSTQGSEQAFLRSGRQRDSEYDRSVLDRFACFVERLSPDGRQTEFQVPVGRENVAENILIGRHFHNFYFQPTAEHRAGFANTWIFATIDFFPDGREIGVRLTISRKTQQTVERSWLSVTSGYRVEEETLLKLEDSVATLDGFSTDQFQNDRREPILRLPTGHFVRLRCEARRHDPAPVS